MAISNPGEDPAMSETPTARPAKSGGFQLPILPDGWTYHVQLAGPDHQTINVGAEQLGGSIVVGVRTGLGGDNQLRSFEVESLGEGVKQSVAITRTLKELAAHEQKTHTAREALLAQIGNPDAVPLREDDGEMRPASGVNAGPETVEQP